MLPPSPRLTTFSAALALVAGSMIGTGVYTSLGFQVAGLPSGFPVMLLWLLGGILSAFGAVNYAELTVALPRSGGEYHLLGRVFHPAVGFLSGWISITVGFPAPVALCAVFFAQYAISATGWTVGSPQTTLYVLALGVIALCTVVHLISVRTSGRAQTALTVVKILLVVFLAVSGFLVKEPQNISFLPRPGDGSLMLTGAFAVGIMYVLYSYTGWNSACYIAGELENPARDVPRSLLWGTALVTVLYMGLNAAFLHSTPMTVLAGKTDVGFLAASHMLGENGGRLVAGCIAAGLVSTISGMLWAGSRVAQMMGQDHPLLAPMARTTSTGVPRTALLIQSLVAVLFVVTLDAERILICTQFSLQLVMVLTVAGVIYLRRKEPLLPRPYQAWGYPWTTVIFLIPMIYVLAAILLERRQESLMGLGNAVLALALHTLVSPPSGKAPRSAKR
ncbi:MAG: amino acid permease-associated region [Verrucomicrobiales bacterium]|nr:amino acid permease-associated region [Verrucomicrobiales bacterium]